MEQEARDYSLSHSNHNAPLSNDGRFDQPNPNIKDNVHNQESDPSKGKNYIVFNLFLLPKQ